MPVVPSLSVLTPAPAHLYRGWGILSQLREPYPILGSRILVLGGNTSLARVQPRLDPVLGSSAAHVEWATYGQDCSERELDRLKALATANATTGIIGVGGGKALDTSKLLAENLDVPCVTIPTSAATCAGWTALSNIYSVEGAFQHDVPLRRAPDSLILDYELIQSAPVRTLRAGIGDALAKWYEASVSSGTSRDVLVIAAVQQARVLRDLLLQNSLAALQDPGSDAWVQTVDACVCLPGVVGGLGGARCRTVAAHAVHNGLTHLPGSRQSLHGEKVAFGILVQLRLEEIVQGSQLAQAARRQLLSFYRETGLPRSLTDLHLGHTTPTDWMQAAEVACRPGSDIHHLPFAVSPQVLVQAMTSTLVLEPSPVYSS